MAFRKVRQSQELEIISLIDVIFLLIIFGIVFSVMRGAGAEEEAGQQGVLTIDFAREVMDPNDDAPPRMMVNILNSDKQRTPYSEKFPQDEDLMKMTLSEFEKQPACVLIKSRIAFYNSLVIADEVISSEFIKITAAHDTKLRIINFVMRECSPYKDQFPWVKFGAK